MDALVYLDLATKQMSDSLGGNRFTIPTHTFGEDITIGIRFAQRDDGIQREVSKTVQELRATIGKVDARPTSGEWGITVDPNGTDIDVTGLAFDVTAATLETDLTSASLGLGTVTVEDKNDSFLITFSSEDTVSTVNPVEIEPNADNSLFPVSFIRHRTFTYNGMWVHEIRLIQAPVASTDQSSRKLPPQPSITTLQDGSTVDGVVVNEIQELYLPPTFRGLYQIQRGSAKTRLFSIADGAAEVEEALNADGLADEGGVFSVENVENDKAQITFGGDMEGTGHDEMSVVVYSAPEGDLTFNLTLDTIELAALLREFEEVTLPFEIEADIEDDDDDTIVYTRSLYFDEITIRRELHWEELSTAANIDWLRPPLNEVYGGFDYSAVSNGQLHYSDSYGDGTTSPFNVDHNLNADDVTVLVKKISTGELLVLGTDFSVDITNSNTLQVTPITTPASNDWRVTILALEQTSSFDPHTHAISDITGLQTILDDYGTRVAALEALAPSDLRLSLATTTGAYLRESTIPNFSEVFPANTRAGKTRLELGSRFSTFDPEILGRGQGRLYGALHKASTTSLDTIDVQVDGVATLPVASDSYIDTVYENDTGDVVTIPGGGGHPSDSLAANEFVSCDGDYWYKVVQYGSASETSYYPVNFERTIFTQGISGEDLISNRKMEVVFDFEVGLVDLPESSMVAYLVVETGTWTGDSTPATTGGNLQNITWAAAPAHSERLLITDMADRYQVGYRVVRDGSTLTGSALTFGTWKAATEPSTTDFAVRARLIRWDTENAADTPRGRVFLSGPSFEDSAQTSGKLIIS